MKKAQSYITFILSVVLIGIGEYFVKSKDICNLIIISVMLITVLAEAFICRRKLLKITNALRKAAIDLKKENTSYNYEDDNFINRCLKSYFIYKDEFEGDKNLIDISDYINEEIIANEIHKDITDQIANAMTGLGILGTFIGLSIGLQDFHTDGAQAITDSIPALLNGIKTAFYTSISGVIISLIFTHFYQNDLVENRKALDDFYKCFYDNISPDASIYYYDNMLKNQQEQTAALNALAASIGDELAPRLATEIKNSIVPTMEKLNEMIKGSINNTIDEYIKEAVKTQSNTLQGIVDEFMNKLNNSLRNQFEVLAESIEHMCRSQHSYTDEIQIIIESLTGISNNLRELNEDMTGTANVSKEINQTSYELYNQLRAFISILSDYQKTTKEAAEQLSAQTTESIDNLNKNYDTYFDNIDLINRSISELVSNIYAFGNKVEERIGVSDTNVENLINNINTCIDSMRKIQQNFTKQMQENKEEADKNTASYVNEIKSFTDVLLDITGAMKQLPKKIDTSIDDGITKLSQKNIEHITKVSEQYLEGNREIVGTVTKSLSSLPGQMERLADQNEKMRHETGENFKQITSSIEKVMTNSPRSYNSNNKR